MEQQHLTPQQLSDRFGGQIKVSTLRTWRCLGNGPRYITAGRAILYPLDAVIEWEQQNTVDPRGKHDVRSAVGMDSGRDIEPSGATGALGSSEGESPRVDP